MKAIDLYEKCQLCTARDTKSGNKDATFQTHNPKNKGKKWGKKEKKDIKCFNCHKKGHFSYDCYGPGGNKEGQGLRSKKDGHKPKEGSSNTMNDAPDGTWSAIIPIENCKVATCYDDSVYLEEVDKVDGLDGSDAPPTSVKSGLKPTDINAAHVAQPEPSAHSHTPELYDSGATCHMTPLKDSLTNYRVIPPRLIGTVNQCTFDALGCSNLMILVPNGNTNSRILLRNMLHTPDVMLTLISVRCISNAGYSILFKDRTCTICDGKNAIMGKFPKRDGLYKVDRNKHSSASAHTVSGPLTIMDAHQRLRHISPDAIKALTCEGTVTGLHILKSSLPLSCDSCTYGKMMHKPSPKERTGAHSNKFSSEVHTDMWGPSPTKSLGSKTYYNSFTDDKTRYTKL